MLSSLKAKVGRRYPLLSLERGTMDSEAGKMRLDLVKGMERNEALIEGKVVKISLLMSSDGQAR